MWFTYPQLAAVEALNGDQNEAKKCSMNLKKEKTL